MYYNQPIYRTIPSANHAAATDANQIRVSGEGSVAVQPDKVDIILGVSTENRELKIAQSENAASIQNIINAIKEMGIPEQNIRTSDYSIYPQYEFSEGKPIFRGYKVDHLLNVTIEDIKKAGTVVDTAVTNGANTVSRLRFSVKDEDQSYRQALAKAIHDAYQKAITISGTLRVNLNPIPVLVSEGTFRNVEPIPYEATTLVKGAAATPIEPGTLNIRATVQVIYQYYV